MAILLICCTIAFCTLCLMIVNVKKITAKLYERMITDENLPKSPYGLIRTKNYMGHFGYTITKDGEIIYIPGKEKKSYEVFSSLDSAINQINVYEKLEGYRLTRIYSEF